MNRFKIVFPYKPNQVWISVED